MQFALSFVVPDIGEDNEKEVQMQTLTVFFVIMALVALVTFGLARFHHKVASAAEDKHWITNTTVVGVMASLVVFISALAVWFLLLFNHYNIAHIPLNVAKLSLLVQVTMAALLFVLPVTRQAALRSTEGRVVMTLISVTVYLFAFAAKLILGLFKLSARSPKNGRETWDTRGAWSQHGNEGHVERSERIRGKPFGDHL